MPGDWEYSNYEQDMVNAGITNYTTPTSLRGAIGKLATKIGTLATPTSTVSAPTLGAAAQLANLTVPTMLYIDVSTAGNLVVAIGPTVAVANTLFSGTSPIQMVTVRLPAAWYIAVTTSNTGVWSTTAITA